MLKSMLSPAVVLPSATAVPRHAWTRSYWRLRPWVTGGVVALALMTVSAPAHAEFGVKAFDTQITADAGGTAFTQAGGHPYAVSTKLDFNTHPETEVIFGLPFELPWPDEPTKDVVVEAPPGLVGNPTVVAKCTMSQLAALPSVCPAESQVGTVTIRTGDPTSPPDNITVVPGIALYNLVPPPDVPARFAFNLGGVIVTLDASLRSQSDYGLSVRSRNISQGLAIIGTDVTLWGTPADPGHDAERFCAGGSLPGCAFTGDVKPFLTIPTACTAPGVGLETRVNIDSWVHPGVFKHGSVFSHLAPNYPDPGWPGVQQGPTGCDAVPFDATLSARPDNLASPAATGFQFDLAVPQGDDPITHLAPSQIKKVSVTLPEGVRVSPASAQNLQGCTPQQLGLHTLADPTCPSGSNIGSLRIDTPLLDEPLTGSVYLATPHDNPSGALLALYLVAKGPGVIVKIPGSVSASQADGTGQLSATFDNNPQVPFSKLHLQFDGGTRAPLANPPRCGTYTTHAVLTSWSGKTLTSDSSFTTSHDGRGAPCPAPHFSPQLKAGTANPVAGASSPLSLTLTRSDDDDELKAIQSISTPKGLLARIASLGTLCPANRVRAGTCSQSTRIGTVTAAAGPGPNPFAVSGSVYLGGRFKGAPFSLSIVVPVKAGPFDLGTVVVASAIHVDRHTAQLHITTDPLPTIIQGIPLQVRLVNVTIDRPGFTINPTNCTEQHFAATVQATTGRIAHPGSRFQVGNCGDLALAPRLSLKVGAKGRTHGGVSTPLTTVLRMPRGGSNLKTVKVSLPLALSALLPVVDRACTRAQYAAGHCAQSRIGSAVAVTPLLAKPLKGSAFLVKNPDRPLPDLIVALRGQVDFDLTGAITLPNGTQLATKFDAPDVPVTKFTLRLVAGKNGPLAAAENLCAPATRRETAQIAYRGQNGDLVRTRQHLAVAGCGVSSHRRHGR